MSNKLQALRSTLSDRNTDLARSYNFSFYSLKLLAPVNISNYIVSTGHPFFQYTNEGDYRGFISHMAKPADITVTFLENDRKDIDDMLNFWDGLKANKETGIMYPKAGYEDQAFLTYIGTGRHFSGNQAPWQRSRKIVLGGFYPINRDPITLSYDNNSVITYNVTFNVDSITMLNIPFTDIG